MSQLPYFTYPGFDDRARETTHYSQAVRLPNNTIHISGQGGWDSNDTNTAAAAIPTDAGEKLDNAFKNVQLTLEKVGGRGWNQVYKVRVYVVNILGPDGPALASALVANLRKWCPDHQPLLTVPGVLDLAIPGMRVEIEVEAYLGS